METTKVLDTDDAERVKIWRQSRAIERADTVAGDIQTLEKHQEVLMRMIRLRLIDNLKYQTIAQNMEEDLQQIGAATHAVRVAVGARVIQATLSPETNRKITSANLSKRPSNLTKKSQREGIKKRQLFNWTKRIDRKLEQVTKKSRRENYAKRSRHQADWVAIARLMNEFCGARLEAQKWQQRYDYLQARKRKASEGMEE